MKRFWVGLKNKKVWFLVFCLIITSISPIINIPAHAISESDCDKWGGTMRGEVEILVNVRSRKMMVPGLI